MTEDLPTFSLQHFSQSLLAWSKEDIAQNIDYEPCEDPSTPDSSSSHDEPEGDVKYDALESGHLHSNSYSEKIAQQKHGLDDNSSTRMESCCESEDSNSTSSHSYLNTTWTYVGVSSISTGEIPAVGIYPAEHLFDANSPSSTHSSVEDNIFTEEFCDAFFAESSNDGFSKQCKWKCIQKKVSRRSEAKAKKVNRPKHNHSKVATDIFKAWFYKNLENPFPSDELKADFADRTGLSYTQVSSWFINIRKRVWKPLNRTSHEVEDMNSISAVNSTTQDPLQIPYGHGIFESRVQSSLRSPERAEPL